MKREIVIVDIRGSRSCTLEMLPLSIGGEGADIELGEQELGEVSAYIGHCDGAVFVQARSENSELRHNQDRVEGSRWLRDGDVLTVGGSMLRCEMQLNRLCLRVMPKAPDLQPPNQAPPPLSERTVAIPVQPTDKVAPRKRRLVTGTLSLLFCVLVVAALFVFGATPVSVSVEPTPESVRFDGLLPSVELGGRRLLWPGEYRLQVQREGYYPIDEQIAIAFGDHVELDFLLEKLPGLVAVSSQPAGAQVLVDGERVGITPLEDLELRAGSHRVLIRRERYFDTDLELEVEGLGKRQTLAVELVPAWAAIAISSSPPGASIIVDEDMHGVTPATLDLLEGTHTVRLSLEKHEVLVTEVDVVANEPQDLPTFTLTPSPAILTIESVPSGASVRVDQVFGGTTPLEMELVPDMPHAITLSKSGYETASRTVTLEPAERSVSKLELRPRYGTVFLTVQPADAALEIDGKPSGTATRRLSLTALPHRLRLSKDGYEPRELTVTPRADASQAIEITLNPLVPVARAVSQNETTTVEGQVLRLVRPKRFMMGASRREAGRRSNESLRLIDLERPFFIGVNEVTNEEFGRFKLGHVSGQQGGQTLGAATQPVVAVTWEEAVLYLNWLSIREGLPPAYEQRGDGYALVEPPNTGYRLPTEAEWAYVSRFANRSSAVKYPWGSTYPPARNAGNYADVSARGVLANTLPDYNDSFPVSAPVGKFPPNPLGIHDLGGNVAEWTHDYYAVYPNSRSKAVKDPRGPASGQHHVVRGSSWRHASISELRLSYRDYSASQRPDLGFRIARYAE